MSLSSAEKSARYRAKDVDAFRAKKRALARTPEHKETRRLYMAKWREENREKHNAQARASHARHREKHKEGFRERHFRKSYGLSVAQRDAMIEAQGSKCLICERAFESSRSTHIDHCHATGRVRGILCSSCNTKLGWFEANADRVAAYLNGETGK